MKEEVGQIFVRVSHVSPEFIHGRLPFKKLGSWREAFRVASGAEENLKGNFYGPLNGH